jgi:phage tail sheath protein FI
LIGPIGANTSEIGYAAANAVIAVAAARKDCVAVVSPPTTGTDGTALQSTTAIAVQKAADWSAGVTPSSYGVMTSSRVYVYDKYNDLYRWVGSAGHVAGLLANVDNVAETWFSPAGYNRGQLRGVIKLGYNPTQSQRNTLYKDSVNPLVSFPGQGIILFGDKTAQSKPSAFDRINVRRLFIALEKAISTASKFQLFELNDEFTRAMFRNMTEPFLRDVKGRRGVTDFLVVCDETNNTGEVIDTNRFVADIFIKPARSINFITLNFIATRTGVEFSEVSGQQ